MSEPQNITEVMDEVSKSFDTILKTPQAKQYADMILRKWELSDSNPIKRLSKKSQEDVKNNLAIAFIMGAGANKLAEGFSTPFGDMGIEPSEIATKFFDGFIEKLDEAIKNGE